MIMTTPTLASSQITHITSTKSIWGYALYNILNLHQLYSKIITHFHNNIRMVKRFGSPRILEPNLNCNINAIVLVPSIQFYSGQRSRNLTSLYDDCQYWIPTIVYTILYSSSTIALLVFEYHYVYLFFSPHGRARAYRIWYTQHNVLYYMYTNRSVYECSAL